MRIVALLPLCAGCSPCIFPGACEERPHWDTGWRLEEHWLAECGALPQGELSDPGVAAAEILDPFVGSYLTSLDTAAALETVPLTFGITPEAYHRSSELADAYRLSVRVSLDAAPWLAEHDIRGTLCVVGDTARLTIDRVYHHQLSGTIAPPWDPVREPTLFDLHAQGHAGSYEGSIELVRAMFDEDPTGRHRWGTWIETSRPE